MFVLALKPWPWAGSNRRKLAGERGQEVFQLAQTSFPDMGLGVHYFQTHPYIGEGNLLNLLINQHMKNKKTGYTRFQYNCCQIMHHDNLYISLDRNATIAPRLSRFHRALRALPQPAASQWRCPRPVMCKIKWFHLNKMQPTNPNPVT